MKKRKFEIVDIGVFVVIALAAVLIYLYGTEDSQPEVSVTPVTTTYAESDKEFLLEDINKPDDDEELDETSKAVLLFSQNLESEMQSTFDKMEKQREKERQEDEARRKAKRKEEEKRERELEKQKAKKSKVKVAHLSRGMDSGRNFANLNLNSKTNFSEEVFRQMLSDTNLEQIAGALVKCEENYNVNGLFLASLAALESGYGTSNIARSKNNITGFQAYDSATHMARRFTSYSDCILYTAKHLSEHYLDEDGKYYNGPTLSGVNSRYSSSNEWANKINKIMVSMLDKLNK